MTEIDEALGHLQGAGTEVARGGMPNHGPMAVEALVALGHGALAPAWAARYRGQLGALPPAVAPITHASWRDALGAPARVTDWIAFFRRQLAEAPWRTVVAAWASEFVAVMPAAGSHGLIRTAHALRSLDDGETPLRLEELGVALAFWLAYAGRFATEPALSGTLGMADALAHVPRLRRGEPRLGMPRQLIFATNHYPEFARAVNAAAEPASVADALGELTRGGAALYLANAGRQPLVLLHMVTAAAALRLWLPHLSAELHRPALAHLWQIVAANAAMFADEPAAEPRHAPLAEAEVVARAIDSDDPHAIKLAEACVREHRRDPDPVYLAAAQDFAERAGLARQWSMEQRIAAGLEFA